MAKDKKSNAGAKSRYKDVGHVIVELHATTDLNIISICNEVNISYETYFRWIKEKPEFCEGIKEAKRQRLEILTTMAQEETIRRIQGYTVSEETREYGKDPKDSKKRILKSRKVSEKRVAASDTLLMYVNNNRDPDNWKHKEHIDHTTKGDKIAADLGSMTNEQLAERFKHTKAIEEHEDKKG